MLLAFGLVMAALPSRAAAPTASVTGARACAAPVGLCIPPTFTAPPVHSISGRDIETTGVHSLTQGDFNGDGWQDLAATAFGGIGTSPETGIGVFLGDGHGSFHPPTEFAAGLYPIDIATAHTRGASAPLDLVVADAGTLASGGSEISVLLGRGDGTFAAPISLALPGSANKVVTADFNGDGKSDIAASTASFRAETGTRSPEELTILIGKGDGTFGPPTNYVAASGVSVYYDMAVGDFTNDGSVDVLGMDPEGLWISRNLGDGTFAPAVPTWVDPSTFLGGQRFGGPTAVTVGDFDSDGNLDAALDVDGGRVDVLLGTGTGLLRPAPVPTISIEANQMGQGSGTLRAVDLTADGHLDIVVTTGYGATLVVLAGVGDGSFAAPAIYPLPSTDDRTLAIADTDGDRQLDVVTITSGGFSGAPHYLTVLRNQGQGRLLRPAQYSVLAPYNSQTVTATNPVGLTLTDLNKDSAPDLVVTEWNVPTEPLANGQIPEPPTVNVDTLTADTHGSIAVFLGDGHGGFLPEKQYFVGARPIAVEAADLTGDGNNDVAVVNGYSGTLSLLQGNGDGTLQPATTTPLGNAPNAIAVEDFNGDRRPDLAVTRYSDNAVSVLLNQSSAGGLAFRPAIDVAVGVAPDGIVAADLDRDGHIDLATANNGSLYEPVAPSTLSVLHGNGDGTFAASRTTTVWNRGGVDAIAVGHFGDGPLDLALANFDSNEVKILRGDGTGEFTQVGPAYGVGDGPEDLVVADFNGDGWDDLAVDSINDNTVGMLLGRGGHTFETVVRQGDSRPTPLGFAAFAYPTFLALGDLNRDGRPDLVTANIFDATVTVLSNTTPRVGRSCVEDSDPAISYGQGWRRVSDPDASGGSVTMTSARGGNRDVSFRFTADGPGAIEIATPTADGGGGAHVVVDGESAGTVSFAGAGSTQDPVFGARARLPFAGRGAHTLEFRDVQGPAFVDRICVLTAG
jgi:hypothetical protein